MDDRQMLGMRAQLMALELTMSALFAGAEMGKEACIERMHDALTGRAIEEPKALRKRMLMHGLI